MISSHILLCNKHYVHDVYTSSVINIEHYTMWGLYTYLLQLPGWSMATYWDCSFVAKPYYQYSDQIGGGKATVILACLTLDSHIWTKIAPCHIGYIVQMQNHLDMSCSRRAHVEIGGKEDNQQGTNNTVTFSRELIWVISIQSYLYKACVNLTFYLVLNCVNMAELLFYRANKWLPYFFRLSKVNGRIMTYVNLKALYARFRAVGSIAKTGTWSRNPYPDR